MTTREDFERKVTIIAKEHNYAFQGSLLKRDGDGYSTTWVDMMWEGYKACAAHYKAKIALHEAAKLYDEAPDEAEFEPPHPIFQLAQERDNYADHIRNLLALIAEKDKALQACDEAMDYRSYDIPITLQQQVKDALSITHDSVRLVEVDPADYDAMSLISDGTKLYTIVKGDAG
jgi:hypothetical protein